MPVAPEDVIIPVALVPREAIPLVIVPPELTVPAQTYGPPSRLTPEQNVKVPQGDGTETVKFPESGPLTEQTYIPPKLVVWVGGGVTTGAGHQPPAGKARFVGGSVP